MIVIKIYKDKNLNIVKDEDFILISERTICQALLCEDNETLLYEELKWNYNKGKVELTNEPNYPDSFEPNEIEIISYNKAIKLLREIKY